MSDLRKRGFVYTRENRFLLAVICRLRAGLSHDVMGKMHRAINTIVVVIRLTDNE